MGDAHHNIANGAQNLVHGGDNVGERVGIVEGAPSK